MRKRLQHGNTCPTVRPAILTDCCHFPITLPTWEPCAVRETDRGFRGEYLEDLCLLKTLSVPASGGSLKSGGNLCIIPGWRTQSKAAHSRG